MLPSHNLRILVATQPVDFRKGHDGLAALAQSALKEDPIRVAHCWAHARRKLKEVFDRDGSEIAGEGLR
uniref:IS66 family insertion sequence element accessory protein TnpB n=1 Tax=Roseovarius sp. TaxID=1486281 RepID=UPI003563E484